ncbi:MAG TPA: hypothetical protein VE781_03800 [Kineosporiaceae bacterium]|jgi:hypothetical protein|nr:hypothetical protein [Kineosporiaceae bacterium]
MADPAETLEVTLLPADDGSDGPVTDVRPRRPSLVVVLAGALVVALVAAGLAGWQLWRDRSLPGDQAEAAETVEAYTRSFDGHDLAALRSTLADQGSFSGGENLDQPVMGPFSGRELDDFYTHLFGADVHLTTDGPPQVTGTGPYRVAVLQTVHYVVKGVPVTEQAVSLFTLIRVEDRPVIVSHVWWRPLAAKTPSMLWAR